jgi:hypothetical protein
MKEKGKAYLFTQKKCSSSLDIGDLDMPVLYYM